MVSIFGIYIIHTCNTHDNRYTALSTSDIYYIFFIVKEIIYLLEMIEGKDPWKSEMHVYFVNIACKSIMVTLLIVTTVASPYYFCQNSIWF